MGSHNSNFGTVLVDLSNYTFYVFFNQDSQNVWFGIWGPTLKLQVPLAPWRGPPGACFGHLAGCCVFPQRHGALSTDSWR